MSKGIWGLQASALVLPAQDWQSLASRTQKMAVDYRPVPPGCFLVSSLYWRKQWRRRKFFRPMLLLPQNVSFAFILPTEKNCTVTASINSM
jgi:hypothetical protein